MNYFTQKQLTRDKQLQFKREAQQHRSAHKSRAAQEPGDTTPAGGKLAAGIIILSILAAAVVFII
ncbi:MAG: hypothetical protein R3293_24075 [Candidatus Promineifilaceae bacterium]|nr:hypothetical protein [Candidatus Promineifilaceae bacterium]